MRPVWLAGFPQFTKKRNASGNQLGIPNAPVRWEYIEAAHDQWPYHKKIPRRWLPVGKVQVHRTFATRGLQIGPMHKSVLQFLKQFSCLCMFLHLFLSLFTPSPSCSNDFYFRITFVWTSFYAYDATLPRFSIHNPLSLHHRIPLALSFLLEKLERSLIHSFSLWALSIFLRKVHLPCYCEDRQKKAKLEEGRGTSILHRTILKSE